MFLLYCRGTGEIGGRRPKLTSEQWAQAGGLIRAGVPRQQVAIIYDVGLSTHGLYWILLSANRKGVKKRDYRAN
ncbi:helix-turn-helix domain-containing protein [Salmonella enterica]|nr:helix-turn-helix domain-containing protein [Salmonella enterica]EHR0948572.1 helix-turn-helix domain-containing protein [Salmonella enterica]EHS0165463.1 helix-turn-helix domain-containing protein [Salmonella enterica]EHT9150304.1 helix-turn-helix domain-containing protein [Salmonella enterica]EIK1955189.1 helix-turn-helix domain-containing protein [Salmonella enterica]